VPKKRGFPAGGHYRRFVALLSLELKSDGEVGEILRR
jgi:hypothetical protein